MTQLEAILKIRKDTYGTRRVVKKVSEYLIIGSNETVRFYHQSFANWLMNQTEGCDDLFIQISRGHQYIVDYLFDYFHKRNTIPTLQELFELSMHVLLGEMKERQISKLKGFNVSEIWGYGECILHKLARERYSTPIIKIFLNKFDSTDILTEFNRLTPLFYAASNGNFENLKLFIDNGADVISVFNSNYFIILKIAEKGHTKIAELLINNGVDFDKESKSGEKPLWRAAWYGHLDFVKLLVNEGVKPDVIALRRAAKRDHSDIVRFLLDRGIRDVCLECKPGDRCSFPTALHAAVSGGNLNIVKLLLSYGKDALECKDRSGRTPLMRAAERDHSDIVRFLLDRGILDVCLECKLGDQCLFPTALHAAVFWGYLNIVKLLLSYGKDALECKDRSGRTPLMRAAERDHSDIVRFLLDRGIRDVCLECEPGDRCFFPTALHVTVSGGRLNIVKLLLSYGKDALECKDRSGRTPLMYPAEKNHSDIVRFLLDRGIRDVCLECKSDDDCWFPTALHAAVSKGYMNIVKLLLSYGKHTLECKDFIGQTPLLRAAERNDTEMATLLLNNGANTEAYSACETRSIHLFAKQRSWEMVKELVLRWNANLFSEDCLGLTPVSFATMQDRVDILRNFTDTYAGKRTKFPIKNTALCYAAVFCSPKTFKWLSSIANSRFFQTVYKDGTTLLHLAANWSAYPATGWTRRGRWEIQPCTKDVYYVGSRTVANILKNANEYKKCLTTVRLLTKLQNINKTDKYGRTALHYAAARGFAGAVRHFVRQGSDWRIKDQSGDTPLELALKERHDAPRPRHFLPCRMTNDGVFKSCTSTMFDETVRYLIMVQKSTIKKCNTYTKRLLHTLVKKNMPLSLYNLFKIGVDVNCGVALKMQLNISKLKNDEISEVFKIFEVNVNVECDVPFNRSELHLMAFLERPNNIGNFFKPSVNNRSFPLQRFINSHPKDFRVLDECRDKEGYLAIHRAVQGGNFEAVSWFISLGVDIFKKTRSGWNALGLSIFSLASGRHLEGPDYIDHEVENLRKRTFEKLLEQFSKTIKYKDLGLASSSWCKPEFTALSPLHIAAFGGIELLNYVHKKVRILPISCTNKHGIEPRYLAYLYEMYTWPFLYPQAAYKGRYPEREAEYHLIYNLFFQTLELDLSFELDFEGLFKCPGLNEFLPKKKEIEGQIKQCNNHCLESTSQVIRNFLSAFPYMVIKNYASFGAFGKIFIYTVPLISELRYHTAKMFHKIRSRFWREVSEAYSCSHRCRCVEIMQLLQEQFTSRRKNVNYSRVSAFVAQRMGWTEWMDTFTDDVLYRWPFRFLLKKALKKDKDYEYLKIIGKD